MMHQLLRSSHGKRNKTRVGYSRRHLPLDTFICSLLLNTEAGEYERLLGHNMVCFGCGKFVRKIRHYVSMECPLLALLLSQNTNYVPSRNNYVCHLCWMRANRQAVHDSSQDMQELASDNDAAAPNVQDVSPPEPPQLPPVQRGPLQRESDTISLHSLPNYTRASITSVHCIYQQCRNRMLHLVPQFFKRLL